MCEDGGEGKLSELRHTQEQCFGHFVCGGCTVAIHLLIYKGMIYLESSVNFSHHHFHLRKKTNFCRRKTVHFKGNITMSVGDVSMFHVTSLSRLNVINIGR